MGELSKRQVLLKYGFNFRTFNALVEAGILTPSRVKTGKRPAYFFEQSQLDTLQERDHYVVCLECRSFNNQITTKHLQACSGLRLAEYRDRHPSAPLVSRFSQDRKAKTELQKVAQSDKLKARFKTEAGEKTRQQIKDAAIRSMTGERREQAAEHLRAMNKDPEVRAATSRRMKALWATGPHREKIKAWHRDNREQSLEMAAKARSHLTHTFSKLHQGFKKALVQAGLEFETEHPVGYYRVDEANPNLKIAIEVDGCYWHGCDFCGFEPREGMVSLDRRKTSYLKSQGWAVLRFPGHRVKSDLDSCIQEVREAYHEAGR